MNNVSRIRTRNVPICTKIGMHILLRTPMSSPSCSIAKHYSMTFCPNAASLSMISLLRNLVRILRVLFLDIYSFSIITALALGLQLVWHIIVAVAKRKQIFIVILTRHLLIFGLVLILVLFLRLVFSKLLSRLIALEGSLSLL